MSVIKSIKKYIKKRFNEAATQKYKKRYLSGGFDEES